MTTWLRGWTARWRRPRTRSRRSTPRWRSWRLSRRRWRPPLEVTFEGHGMFKKIFEGPMRDPWGTFKGHGLFKKIFENPLRDCWGIFESPLRDLWRPWHVQKDVCRGSQQAWRQPWSPSRQEKPSSLPRTAPGEINHNFVQFENNLFPSGKDKGRESRENWQEGNIVLEWAPVFLQNKYSSFIWRQSPRLSELQHSHGICDLQPLIENWFTIFFCANQPLSRRFL